MIVTAAMSIDLHLSKCSLYEPTQPLYTRYNVGIYNAVGSYCRITCATLTCFILVCRLGNAKRIFNRQKYYMPENKSFFKVFKYTLNILYYLGLNVTLWIYAMNLILIIVANPSINNPGPNSQCFNICYQNVQGLIPLSDLGNPNPQLNMSKLTELQAYAYSNKPDVMVLNETWLKPSVADGEILLPDS